MKKKFVNFTTISVAFAGVIGSIYLGASQFYRSQASTLAVSLERCDGYTVRFKKDESASKYVINDDADYRDGLVLTNEDADANGYIYFTAETVGEHNISVTSYVNSSTYLSEELDVTVKPVFYYSEQSNLYFYDIDNESDTSTYSILQKDGSWLKVSRTEYDSNQIKNLGNAVDFSAPEYVYETINAQKQAGANVLFLGSRTSAIERNNYWWFPGSFEESVCKRYMDAAWYLGMKCIITDYTIQTFEEEGDLTTISERLNNKHLRQAFLHPAFYGLQFEDEPAADAIANVGKSAKYILDFWRNDPELSQKDEPIIYTALRSYDENKSETFGYFENKDAYKAYIKSWFDETGLDYVAFDTYTYTTRVYGSKKKYGIFGENLYYDPSKVIYDSFNEVISELGGDKEVFQVITGSTDTSRKASVTSTDVFASMLLAAAQDVSGYAVFTFKENTYSKSSMLNLNQQFTDTYYYHQKANKQYKKIQSILEGYKATSKSISSYGSSYYGPGVRTVDSTFTNTKDTSKTYRFIANFETASSNTTYKVSVPNNTIYYLFGYNYDTYQRVGTGGEVTINNGEAILISNQTISNVADTSFDKSLLSDVDVITISDVAKTYSVNNTDGFGETPSANSETFNYASIRNDNASVALRFNYKADKLGSSWGDGIVDIFLNEYWSSYGFGIGANSGDVCIKMPESNVNIVKNVLKAGVDNIVEVGAAKIKNTTQTYLYIKVNDELICHNVVNYSKISNNVQFYLASGNTANTNVRLESVKLNRENNSGELLNVIGTNQKITFNTANIDSLDYNMASGNVYSYTYNGHTLKKTDYNTFELTFNSPITAKTSIDISGTYTYYDSSKGQVVAFTISDGDLYFDGTNYFKSGKIDLVTSSMKLAYDFRINEKGQITKEKFFLKVTISDEFSEELCEMGEFGIKVSTSSKTKYYKYSQTHLDSATLERYIIIDLGNAISENHYHELFTVSAYLLIDGQYINSINTVSGSIYSMVEEMYNNSLTSTSVKILYNYMNK